MDERERYDKGLGVRRAVLGDAHVDRALAKRSTFNEEFQDLITRYAWGEVWTRPGLPRHTRSLLTIGLMVALNRTEEFKLHVRAAFPGHGRAYFAASICANTSSATWKAEFAAGTPA